INRDSGLSESCSFISDHQSINSDRQSILSDNEHLSDFTSDTFSVISDPLGACSTSDGEGDNNIHFFETRPWDEKQNLEKEWKLLFKSENYFYELSQHALEGKLKHSKFRSIAWKVLLDCLPEDQKEWTSITRQLRNEYELFKQKSLIDPSNSKEDDESLHIFNPLSLDENNPWKQYFKDNELKAVIKQDLDRLYPEIEFFSSSKIKEMMLSLLFCYVKKNKALGYKQGMHELLAPIVYVLDCDSKTHKYMEGDGFREVVRCLIDPAYVEHDAFAIFCQLMEVTETWYQHHNQSGQNTTSKFLSKSEPFAGPITVPPTAIIKKLNKIQDHLLRKHDTDLWFHLKEMNIAPQVYGLRWIRLLFSREFPFQDILVIWDALFAEGSHLDLVEYIYIVMLQTIRNKLMAGNYTTCLSYLMKFPRVHNDVHVYIKRAINLRGIKKSRPTSRTLQPSTQGFSSKQGSQHPEKKTADRLDSLAGKHKKTATPRRPHSALTNFTKRYTPFVEPKLAGLPSNKQEQTDSVQTKEMINKPQRATRPDPLSSPPLARDRTDSTGSNPGRTMKSLSNEIKTKLTRPRSRSRQRVEELEKDHQRLQVQVSHMNTEIERMQGLYLYCGRKLDSYIGLLQEEVMKDTEADRDVVYLSLAGVKQVRDLLKGTLSYRGSSMETEKDFVDIDKGIATRLQISSPNVRLAPTFDKTRPVPQFGKDIPAPLLGKDIPVPQFGKDIPVPQFGKDIPAPLLGKDIPVPLLGKDIPAPLLGKDIPAPLLGKDIPAPLLGGSVRTSQHHCGKDILAPLLGKDIPAPLLGKDIPAPLLGKDIPAPLLGKDIPAPLLGKDIPAPLLGKDIPAPLLGKDIPAPLLGKDIHCENTSPEENSIPGCNATSVEDSESSENKSNHAPSGECVTGQVFPMGGAEDIQNGSKELSLHETHTGSKDQCDDQEFSNIVHSNGQSRAVCCLDSYLEEHFSDSKDPVNITAVPCTTGSVTNNPLQLCSDGNHGNRVLLVSQSFNVSSSDVFKRKDNHLKNASTPDEPLEREFVFVNKDGTARSTQGSPRLSPTHPLESTEDEDGAH
ncbi:hypothetical protein QZH41_008592, partial [Actinostola sp. cb2023]